MTKMDLVEYCGIKAETRNLIERIQRSKAAEQFPVMQPSNAGSYSGPRKDRMESAVIRTLELEKQLQPLIEQNQQKMNAVEIAISSLQDPMQREVLRLRYTDSENFRPIPWRDVALKIYGDDDENQIRAVQRLHKAAIDQLIRL